MTRNHRDLGPFSDLADFAAGLGPAGAGRIDAATARRIVGFDRDGTPAEPRVERRWSRDGLDGEEVSWSVGYGPRTRAWLLRPAGARGPLPGVLALHGHDAFKYHGKEKIADGPDGVPPGVGELRRAFYGGRPFADAIARDGFTVLVPDMFLWGSRRFPTATMSGSAGPSPEDRWVALEHDGGDPAEHAPRAPRPARRRAHLDVLPAGPAAGRRLARPGRRPCPLTPRGPVPARRRAVSSRRHAGRPREARRALPPVRRTGRVRRRIPPGSAPLRP
ncbi:hypothetical protein [Actinoallomurus vinaceus]|uniref:hypothetical protein n=1 Tax=Actinoallomurus vinaceus TaxID=1080074 RepID=UPI0031EAA878